MVVNKEKSLLKLYVNGKEEAKTKITGNLVRNKNDIIIGGEDGRYFWSGRIFDVFFYDRSLSDNEIQELFQCGLQRHQIITKISKIHQEREKIKAKQPKKPNKNFLAMQQRMKKRAGGRKRRN